MIDTRFMSAVLLAGLMLIGCHARPWVFADAQPVTRLPDDRPIPVPDSSAYSKIDYYTRSLFRRPVVRTLEVRQPSPSRDVNALDEVPASSWFTPRLGYRDLSPAELVAGPVRHGPPVPPLDVLQAAPRAEHPRFLVRDARGVVYFIKFDTPGHRGLETASAVITNRLFWGFGYNVPEDHLYYLGREDLRPTRRVSARTIDDVLAGVARPHHGTYRATASRRIDGILLGPAPERGVRKDDPNDLFPHEELRVLRALRLFCAFTNHTDLRIDNFVDTYVGEPGKGHVRHYLIDFSESLGAHATAQGKVWDGFQHIFDFKDVASKFLTAGLKVDSWESLQPARWRDVGFFEAAVFDPARWKESYPYEPIRHCSPADMYWAAKILSALTRDHLAAVVSAGGYRSRDAEAYVLATLLERKRKVLDHAFRAVTPLEFVSLENSTLKLAPFEAALSIHGANGRIRRFAVQLRDDARRLLGKFSESLDAESTLTIDLPVKTPDDGSYLFAEIREERNGGPAPSAVQFHFRRRQAGGWKLVGIVR